MVSPQKSFWGFHPRTFTLLSFIFFLTPPPQQITECYWMLGSVMKYSAMSTRYSPFNSLLENCFMGYHPLLRELLSDNTRGKLPRPSVGNFVLEAPWPNWLGTPMFVNVQKLGSPGHAPQLDHLESRKYVHLCSFLEKLDQCSTTILHKK